MWFEKILLDKHEVSAYTLLGQPKGDNIMRIAICDDELTHRESLMAALADVETLSKDTVILDFSSGTVLLNSHMRCPFDIVFLDMEMDGMTGLETGQELRNVDRNVIIIYITGFEKYVFESFKIEPFDYILKPVGSVKIREVLCRALKKHREQYYIVDFKWHDKSYALRACDIVHVESNLRHLIFVTENNSYKSIGKLNDFEHRLSPYGFLRCHQSFLINMKYIKCIENRSIKTTLGNEIDMSSRRKQDCLNAFNEYITKYKV